ncbi:hypothetical protein ATK17_3994 [Branchiibius hedensis]|uniref:Uncharacterized protein n=1 Tax=Branchiibius hedensis TaxID=672460 RepID=A0A2Y9BN56_9MICO|nr:hypothetical protein ATK17_3994 [Branchiibius hedensis]SSA59173.1 hypothetical protein SAMN04489750_3994 [Branchiibius hedensis]
MSPLLSVAHVLEAVSVTVLIAPPWCRIDATSRFPAVTDRVMVTDDPDDAVAVVEPTKLKLTMPPTISSCRR